MVPDRYHRIGGNMTELQIPEYLSITKVAIFNTLAPAGLNSHQAYLPPAALAAVLSVTTPYQTHIRAL